MARFSLRNALPSLLASFTAICTLSGLSLAQSAPVIAPAFRNHLAITRLTSVPGSPAQMAWGPGGKLYVRTVYNGVYSYDYDLASAALSNQQLAVSSYNGIGIAFHGSEMYLSGLDGSIRKLTDANGNGVWGESGVSGEINVAIVTGIPVGDHDIDQIQIVGDTLYVGIGRRTINGYTGPWTSGSTDDFGGKGFWAGGLGDTYGDCAYGGTIAMIRDLTQVKNITGYSNTLNPKDTLEQRIKFDFNPYRDTADYKLVIHSAGTRNPFGLCLDANNDLFFTNNFNRVQTMGNGNSGFGLHGDLLDSDFSKDVQDQLFEAKAGADYGYHSSNWTNRCPFLMRDSSTHQIQRSITFDNLRNPGPYKLHNPAQPDGLGPSASADGCDFWYNTALPSTLYGDIFITRYNGTISEAAPGTASLTYADVIAVDVSTGKVVRVAQNFVNPLCVLADTEQGFLLIGDYSSDAIYAISAH